jgi:hypothetical protein
MNKAKITFSNNEVLTLKEGDYISPIVSIETEEGISSALGKPIELWSHVHDGLIPSLTELFYTGQFFFKIDERNMVYNTSAIVKIENI